MPKITRFLFEGNSFLAPDLYYKFKSLIEKTYKKRSNLKRERVLSGAVIRSLIPKSFFDRYSKNSGFGYILKSAGLFDQPKKILCPDIFTPQNYLYPHIKDQVISLAKELVPEEAIKEIVLLGSLVGYQWSEDSDLDVNISVYPHELLTEELNIRRHLLNNRNNFIKGTQHKINLYLTPWTNKSHLWQDNIFGVYDILNNKWLAFPQSNIRNPQEEYKQPLIFANMVLRNYVRLYVSYKKALQELIDLVTTPNLENPLLHKMHLERKKREVIKKENDLISFIKSIDLSRKFEYSLGWGFPRKNYRNVLFKLFELKAKNKNFEEFKEQRLPLIDKFKLNIY